MRSVEPRKRLVKRRGLSAIIIACAAATFCTPVVQAATSVNDGSIAVHGAIDSTYTIAGGCLVDVNSYGTSITLRTQPINGSVLEITGTEGAPSSSVDLSASGIFNVQFETVTASGRAGSWLAGNAGSHAVGSGTLKIGPGGESGSIAAGLVPYGGNLDSPLSLSATWHCNSPGTASSSTTSTTNAPGRGASPIAVLLSRVPSSYFGCDPNSGLNLAGAGVLYRYNAIAEVDCEVEGVEGIQLVVYTLYPSERAMNDAFSRVWIRDVAKPKADASCGSQTFTTRSCSYRIGRATAAAGDYVRLFQQFSSDPYPIPAIAWTSNRYNVITYLAGAESTDTSAVLNYWRTGDPNPR